MVKRIFNISNDLQNNKRLPVTELSRLGPDLSIALDNIKRALYPPHHERALIHYVFNILSKTTLLVRVSVSVYTVSNYIQSN